jgi:alcohol dehydrogenase (NADP+)
MKGGFKTTRTLSILSSARSRDQICPWWIYLELLDVKGTFIQVGAPEDPIPQFHAFALIRKNVKVGGSSIGSPATIREMFALAAQQKVKAWIQERPMGDANQAIVDMENGKARYRYVLVN